MPFEAAMIPRRPRDRSPARRSILLFFLWTDP